MALSSNNPLLILGGGLMGLALAHALAKQGRTVQVLSRRRNEAAGFVAAGMLAPHAAVSYTHLTLPTTPYV